MVGEDDHAYGRVERCRAFDEAIRRLRGDRKDIYPVTLEVKAGFGHGGLPDRDKIKDLYPAVRTPVPRELTWQMTDGVIRSFYWLQVPESGKGKIVEATCRDNRVVAAARGVKALRILLDGRLIDLRRPVTLEVNGKVTTVEPRPSLLVLCRTLLERSDPRLAFTVAIEVSPGTPRRRL
jgi:hypothetical protein